MRATTIIKTIGAIMMTATILTSTGCKSKQGASSGGCLGKTEMDSRQNMDKRTSDS